VADRGPTPPRARAVAPPSHLGARLVTGPLGRGVAFALDFLAALARALRGRPEHPEERRAARD
jgi:hypothetical protein